MIWKQHDAGLYGRRIDQICRSYQTLHPDHRIIVLEILNPDIDNVYNSNVVGFSEFAYIREMNTLKSQVLFETGDNVQYRQIYIQEQSAIHSALEKFLVANEITPLNSVIILFPNIQHIERVFDLLSPYSKITDVIDNQLSWATGEAELYIVRQYFMLCQMCDRVIFNSVENQNFFNASGLVRSHSKDTLVVPNWYQVPDFIEEPVFSADKKDPERNSFNIIYSGNMNDRIDWALIEDIVQLDDRIRLHLVGEARQVSAALRKMLENPRVVYYGPLTEAQTLEKLMHADIAIIPHVTDSVSRFMNPLKVQMYNAIGLFTISMNVPGLEEAPHLIIAQNRDQFLTAVTDSMGSIKLNRREFQKGIPRNDRRYIAEIEDLRNYP